MPASSAVLESYSISNSYGYALGSAGGAALQAGGLTEQHYVGDPTPGSERLTPDELRGLFLFEALSHEQRSWIAERGWVETHPAGSVVLSEGEPLPEGAEIVPEETPETDWQKETEA